MPNFIICRNCDDDGYLHDIKIKRKERKKKKEIIEVRKRMLTHAYRQHCVLQVSCVITSKARVKEGGGGYHNRNHVLYFTP